MGQEKPSHTKFAVLQTFYQNHKLLIWIGLVMCFNLVLNIVYFAFNKMNSDFVAILCLFDDLFEHKVWLSPDNFLLKFPLYSLLIDWIGYKREAVVVMNMVNSTVLFSGLFAFYSTFVRRERNRGELAIIAFLPLFVLVNQSRFLHEFIARPFLRNSEIGIMFLLIGLRDWVEITKLRWAIVLVLAASLLFLSDPYFIYVFAIPIILTLFISYIVRGKIDYQDRFFGLLVIMAVLLSMLSVSLLNKTGYFVILKARSAFVSWDKLGFNIKFLGQGLLKLVNADFMEGQLYSLQTLTNFLNLLILGISLYGLLLLWKEKLNKGNLSSLFIPVVFAVSIGTSSLSDQIRGLHTSHYLVIVPFICLFGLYFAISRWVMSRKPLATVLLSLMVVSIPLNIYNLGASLRTVQSVEQQYNENFSVLNTIREEGLTYGYADFWDAAIHTFLSGNEIRVRQISCWAGKISPYLWISSKDWYKPDYYEGRTFILLEKGELYRRTGVLEYLDQVEQQFGSPEKTRIIETDNYTYYLLIFDHNIASGF